MTNEEKALDYFCDDMEGYILAVMEEADCGWDAAVDIAISEYDEFWRACLESAERGDLD